MEPLPDQDVAGAAAPDPDDPRPRSRLTVQVRRDVLADITAFRLLASTAAPRPDPVLLARVAAEVDDALVLFEARGWLDDPASYHVTPPAPEGVRAVRDRRVTRITWDDGYAPHEGEPGAARYGSYGRNRIARATLIEHGQGDRPWLVCVHGFGMGTPRIDLRGFRATHLYRQLGVNLAFVTLPFHGRRNPSSRPLPAFPGADVLDNVHGFAQSVWDVRQVIRMLRARTDQPVGLLGLSLGGCVSALVASIDDDVHAAALLVPLVDLAAIAREVAGRLGGDAAVAEEQLARAQRLLEPVSPLVLRPKVPLGRRAIVAGTLDQFVRPNAHAVPLWRHWERPALHWYHGGHVSFFWSPRARAAIDAAVRETLLA